MIVVSDLEGTLTTGATVRGFASYMRSKGNALRFNLFWYSQLPAYGLVKAHLIDEGNFRVGMLEGILRFLKGTDSAELGQVVDWIIENELWPKRRPDVIAELQAHSQDGHRVVIVSGTFAPIAEAFAQRIGVEAVGSTLALDPSGRLTGKLTGSVSVREEKVERIRAMANGDAILAAYGDTDSDVPMLNLAENPVAVYPNNALRKAAQLNGWRILEAQA